MKLCGSDLESLPCAQIGTVEHLGSDCRAKADPPALLRLSSQKELCVGSRCQRCAPRGHSGSSQLWLCPARGLRSTEF